ncbi:testis-expressed protein 101-like isoform X2 [Macrotis lagotis]|uniref:testis-expressed protein 101-like isoform X2 n=1 Tax=Macrotis lagotis TaxID=92651 RepID=UPI003D6936E2
MELSDLQCQTCATPKVCPEDSPYTRCPQGSRCYQGIIQLVTGNFSLPLAIWGCGSWTDCGLLDDWWTLGPMALKETCEDQRDVKDLSGKQTVKGSGASPDPSLAWKVSLGSVLALWGCFPPSSELL